MIQSYHGMSLASEETRLVHIQVGISVSAGLLSPQTTLELHAALAYAHFKTRVHQRRAMLGHKHDPR